MMFFLRDALMKPFIPPTKFSKISNMDVRVHCSLSQENVKFFHSFFRNFPDLAVNYK